MVPICLVFTYAIWKDTLLELLQEEGWGHLKILNSEVATSNDILMRGFIICLAILYCCQYELYVIGVDK